MPSQVATLSRRLHSTGLARVYPRFARAQTMKPAAEVDPTEIQYVPHTQGQHELFLATPPKPRWRNVLELNSEEYLSTFNQLLIYRALKLLYGIPDVASALVDQTENSALQVDWSFTLCLSEQALCEVRRRYSSRVHIVIWSPRIQAVEHRKELNERVAVFCERLDEFLTQNGHLWDEASDLPSTDPYIAIENVAEQKYRGALRLLATAKTNDHRLTAAPLPVGTKLQVPSFGYLYAAAAVQFFVALEALVNLLYTQLLRPEFQSRTYQRLTIHSEIDLRLAALHVFCSGFARQPLSPGSDLWKRIVELRDFRNNMVHGNVTEEHSIHCLQEDEFLFFYAPSSDYRGKKLEARRQLPRNQSRMSAEIVEHIKSTVDQARQEIIAAMDEPTRNWVNTWIDQAFVPPRTAGDA